MAPATIEISANEPSVSPSMDEWEPRLPAEIELYIFQLAYDDSSGADRTRLLLVAKRVSEWLIPLLYNHLMINSDEDLPPAEILQKHGYHVKHVCMQTLSPRNTRSTLLSLCPNIHDLLSWEQATLPSNVIHLPIKQLGILSITELDSQLKTTHQLDQIHAWWSNITHLFWGSIPESSRVSQSLLLLPNLTHLQLGNWNRETIVGEVMEICPRLEVVVWVLMDFQSNDETLVIEPNLEKASGFDDIRVVTIDVNMTQDWIRGARGEVDMWVIAERKVKERKAMRRRIRE